MILLITGIYLVSQGYLVCGIICIVCGLDAL